MVTYMMTETDVYTEFSDDEHSAFRDLAKVKVPSFSLSQIFHPSYPSKIYYKAL